MASSCADRNISGLADAMISRVPIAYDAVNGTLRVCKARVAGIDKNCTKTGDDRIVTLCPRAIRVVARQLKLRERLKVAGRIDHDHLFFTAEGRAIRHLRTTRAIP